VTTGLDDVDADTVEMHALVPQTEPYEQHPPPSDAAQRNIDVRVQTRPQHAGATVVIVLPPSVLVTVAGH
jgi:hypothetical protein